MVHPIDVLPPYTTDMWQIEMQNILFDAWTRSSSGTSATAAWTASANILDNHAATTMPLFKESPADVDHLEFTNKNFDELEAFRDFPTDKKGARRGAWSDAAEPAGGPR